MDEIKDRHRKEQKELRAKIQQLKKSAQSKQAKKEAQAEIARLEHEIDQRHKEELEAFSSLSIEESEINNEEPQEDCSLQQPQQFKQSKQQKRKQKRLMEMEKMMEEARKEAEHQIDYKKLEEDAINDILIDLNLRIHQIPADGHCLYNAIAHQLSLKGEKKTFSDVRKLTADYLRDHASNFIPFLVGDDGNLLSHDEFLAYCDKVESSAEWGGQIELQAISQALKRRIKVVTSQVVPVQMGLEFPEEGQLQLSYHKHAYGLGEHYNSLQSK